MWGAASLLLLLLLSFAIQSWKTDRRPKLFGDRVRPSVLVTSSARVQRKLVFYHNYFRQHVAPRAADMLAMSWHRGAARSAQRWAASCARLDHDTPTGRRTARFGSCGQNIFISTSPVPWLFALKTWFLERGNFTYGSERNSLDSVGHYTQMVGASSHRLGCGYAPCPTPAPGGGGGVPAYHSYVCNYCPMGDVASRGLGRPYSRGPACSSCPGHCTDRGTERRGRGLCTNSCPAADLWANCAALRRASPRWLCHDDARRRRHCRATCTCRGKIT